jgi:branched-chain amino acid transport system substrate-binding protein
MLNLFQEEAHMFKKSVKRVSGCVVVGLLAGFMTLGGVSEAFAQTFKIGAICSLTGGAAAFGIETCTGKSLWAEAKNKMGGLKGMKIEFVKYDDETSTQGAVNAYRRFVQEKARIIWMWTSSTTILAVKPLAAEGQIPILCGGGSDRIGIPADPWVFKPGTSTSSYIKATLKWAQSKGYKKIASISGTDAFGQTEKEKIAEYAPRYGIDVVAQETFAPTDTNFTAQLVNIRRKNPDLIYSAAAGAPAILVYQQIKQLGINTPLSLNAAALNEAFFKAVGGAEALEGIFSPTNLGSFGEQLPGESGRHYKELRAALGREATVMETFGWDNGILTEWALNHSDGSPKGLRDAIASAKDVVVIGGPVTFTPDNHFGIDERGVRVGVFRKGKLVFAD